MSRLGGAQKGGIWAKFGVGEEEPPVHSTLPGSVVYVHARLSLEKGCGSIKHTG